MGSWATLCLHSVTQPFTTWPRWREQGGGFCSLPLGPPPCGDVSIIRTGSFLLALRRVISKHGAPRRFKSYQGDQLLAAAKRLRPLDLSKVDEVCSQRNATWRLVPRGIIL